MHGGKLGTVFVSALKAIAPVLVAVLVAASIAKAGGGLGSRFRVVISRYMLSTFIAALCAVAGSFLFPVTLQLRDVIDHAAPGSLTDVFTNLLTNMVTNPMMSVSQANYIGILFWSVLIGIALKMKASEQTISVVREFSDVITLIVKWIIQAQHSFWVSSPPWELVAHRAWPAVRCCWSPWPAHSSISAMT